MKWKLVKNDSYWDKKDVKLKSIDYSIQKTPTTAYNLYQSGKLDAAVLDAQGTKQLKNQTGYTIRKKASTQYLSYNMAKRPEFKNAEIGENTKVGHLTYVGDATLGKDINIGCGTIFSNYDGVKKFHTNVGDHSFIGAGATIIAPVNIADHAFVAADSTITKDVEKYDMAIARGRQTNKPDYWHKLPLAKDKEWE